MRNCFALPPCPFLPWEKGKPRSLPSSLKPKGFASVTHSTIQSNSRQRITIPQPIAREIFVCAWKCVASCLILHSYFVGEGGGYQYDLLVQSYFFTKPRRLIDKPAAGKREGNSYPSFNAKGGNVWRLCERESTSKQKLVASTPSYYSQSSEFIHTHFSCVRKRQSKAIRFGANIKIHQYQIQSILLV